MRGLMLFTLLCLATVLSGATLTVRQDGLGDFTAIQEAFDAASDGDTVLVWPGRYYENLNPDATNHLTLASLEMTTGNSAYIDSTVIDGNRTSSCIWVQEADLTFTLRGFTLTNGTGVICGGNRHHTVGGAMCVNPYIDIQVINCRIFENRAYVGGGFWLGSCCNLYLEGTTIRDNISRVKGGGLSVENSSTVTFSDTNRCSIYNNIGASGMDICSKPAPPMHVIVDTFTVVNPSPFFANSSRNTYAITFDILNGWMEEIDHDLYVSPWGDDDNSGLSEADPLRTIAVAVQRIASDSLNPKTVHIAPGTYSPPNGQILAVPGKAWVTLQGAGEDETILDIGGYGLGVIVGPYMNHAAVRDLTIRNGGSGLSARRLTDFLLENVTISDCEAKTSASMTYEKCQNNIIRNLTISNNCAVNSHAGPYLICQENLVMSNVLIKSISSGEDAWWTTVLDLDLIGDCLLENVRIINNDGHSDHSYDIFTIGPDEDGTMQLRMNNCLFAGNTRDTGPAQGQIHAGSDGSAVITNCTFANNYGGGAFVKFVGDIVLSNNTFWNPNIAYEIVIMNVPTIPSEVTFQYNNIRGGQSGVLNESAANTVHWLDGNVNIDPGFCMAPGMEYVLFPGSPLIDIGTPDTTGLCLPPFDLGGNERVWDGDDNGVERIDIGCYEYQTMPPPSQLEAVVEATDVHLSWLPPETRDRSHTGYRIYRDSIAVIELPDPSATGCTDVNVPPGERRFFVTATYGVLDSPPTNEVVVTIDPDVYAPPTDLEGAVDGCDVLLNWMAPGGTARVREERDLTGYMIYRDNISINMINDPGIVEFIDEDAPADTLAYWVTALYGAVESVASNTVTVVVPPQGNNESISPLNLELFCYPNPMNPRATIHFSLPQPNYVDIDVFNIRGELVRQLIHEIHPSGYHSIIWDGTNDCGEAISTGVYLVRLQAGEQNKTSKLLMLK
ncbi:MAG: T9SS type A sorting domain-containing protein [Candidatus Cloacimonetes bacterium]|nr:T9SS type A sorting domain-containing protein [Candidatus Cloacimonadota bacterium]